jgi:hypothetical protein
MGSVARWTLGLLVWASVAQATWLTPTSATCGASWDGPYVNACELLAAPGLEVWDGALWWPEEPAWERVYQNSAWQRVTKIGFEDHAFWILTPGTSWRTDEDAQQFRYFRDRQWRFLAFEDLPVQAGDWDYNDVIIAFVVGEDGPPSEVPEPGTLSLLGVGCFWLARRVRSHS